MAGHTQEALYEQIDLDLSWSEQELPQVQRTKHVHGLHPYLGKYIPQLVEVFLERYFSPGEWVYDPFVGSGTTLVEANVFGAGSVGCDVSAFNCLLTKIKTGSYGLGTLELSLRGVLEDARKSQPGTGEEGSQWLRDWYSPNALAELLAYRAVAENLEAPTRDVAAIVLSRAARSARLTTHFDLDFPRRPVTEPYYCHKHKRTCRPVTEAAKFLRRYTNDTTKRIREFSSLRTEADVMVLHEDSRSVALPVKANGVITSPPYPGLIDYHEQHRYAYELLDLSDRQTDEIGAAKAGTGRAALERYQESMVSVLSNAVGQLQPGSPVIVVVNDSRDLYPAILDRLGLELEDRLSRHVNRRTGRRAGEFFESILVCRT